MEKKINPGCLNDINPTWEHLHKGEMRSSYWHEWLCMWCRKCGYAETKSLAADCLFAHIAECDKNPIKLNDFEEQSNYWGE